MNEKVSQREGVEEQRQTRRFSAFSQSAVPLPGGERTVQSIATAPLGKVTETGEPSQEGRGSVLVHPAKASIHEVTAVTGDTLSDAGEEQHLQPKEQALERIAATTYPFIAWAAKDLFTRLQEQLERAVEPVDFGTTALDVGSRDGRYMQVIRELGMEEITAIDPSPELQTGVDEGYIRPEEAFQGTLEEYIRSGGKQVDTVFIFNVNPDLPRSQEFIDSLMQVVKPGGIVVSSCIEKSTYFTLAAKTYLNKRLIPVRLKKNNNEEREEPERHMKDRSSDGGGVNQFLTIGRRTTKNVDFY